MSGPGVPYARFRKGAGSASTHGYILLEAIMAMMLLSLGMVAIQASMRQAVITRGDAIDYTAARFLLDEIMGRYELQPLLAEGANSGVFEAPYSRFKWQAKVTKIPIPMPPIPPTLPPEVAAKLKLAADYMAKIEVTVTWQRNARPFKETAETVWIPQKLFSPEELKP